MYNKDIPYNDLPLLPPNINFDDIDILKAVNLANKGLAGLNYAILELPNPYLLIEPLSAREAVASSKIENINTTVAEVFQAKLFPEKIEGTTQSKVLNYSQAILKGYTLIRDQGYLSTNSYIEIQKILEPTKEGIRKSTGTKIVNDITHEVIYTPPEGEKLIRDLLKNYEDYFNDFSDKDVIDPLIKLAILHYQFEAIHPFEDGNGRSGRILMVLHTVLGKLLNVPVLFISGYIDKNRSEYYRLLRNVTEKNEWKEWILYILNGIRFQSEATTETVLALKGLQYEFRQRLSNKFPSTFNLTRFIDYLFSAPFYTQNQAVRVLGINRKTAHKYFTMLESEGLLKKYKHKKEYLYLNDTLWRFLQ